jgi:hypothetical protein
MVATGWVALKHGARASWQSRQAESPQQQQRASVERNTRSTPKRLPYLPSAVFEGSVSRSRLLEDGSYMSGKDNLARSASIKHGAGQGRGLF